MGTSAITGTTRKAHTWCGPYALALVSGLTYDQVYKKLLRNANAQLHRFQPRIKYLTGVGLELMERVSKTVKCKFEFTRVKGKPTLNQFMNELRPNRIYVIHVTRHYLVVDTSDWTVCDNQIQRWVSLPDYKYRLSRVRDYAEVRGHKL